MIGFLAPWTILEKAVPDSSLVNFQFGVPMELVRSSTSTQGRRGIRGVASSEKLDIQKESVIQKGLDLRYFLKHGYYNDDHKPGAANKVGQPTVAKIQRSKVRKGAEALSLWTEGYLWKAGLHEGADRIWELAKAMSGSNSDRCMGFSIQGKVLERGGHRIVRAWVQDIAVTPSPINTDTWLELADSLSKSVWASSRETDDLYKSISDCRFDDTDLMESPIWEEPLLKSLAAQSNPALSPESLEGKLKVPSAGVGCDTQKALRWSYKEARSRGYGPTESRTLAMATVARLALL